MVSWIPTAPPEAPAAEAARTLLRTATTVALHLHDVPGLVAVGGHAADARGRLLVPTSEDDRVLAAARRAPGRWARAVLTDVAPLPVRSRWRARAELTGGLAELAPRDAAAAWRRAAGDRPLDGRRLLVLTPRQVTLCRLPDDPVQVCPHAYAGARPDPVADVEAELLWHLQAGHPELVVRLADLLPRRLSAGAQRVVPVRLDRYALVLRVERERAQDDVDVPLALACRHAQAPGEVLAALRALLDTCPRRSRRA